ncbi:MAG: thioredoxin reductase [Candidatus Woesearchaeota archaeon]|nr:thioredoxin reductase [Candidatus Woesearchaeota archaeon]MDN5327521.1 thioredoxin reductase [Candidatus Woesearchaeota archaeon]
MEVNFNLGSLGKSENLDLNQVFDLAIIGSGPAGYSAAIYGRRYELNTIVIGKEHGGMITETNLVENYPGFKEISGLELMNRFKEHALKFDAKILNDTIVEIKKEENHFILRTQNNEFIKSKTIIIATGTKRRQLNAPGEKEFLNKGVSYCAICDAPFYKGKVVGVVGGSDAAASSAVQLTQYASKIYMFVRSKVRAEPYWQKLLKKNSDKIEILEGVQVKEIFGDEKVRGVKLDNGQVVELDGLFIEIGSMPVSELTKHIGVEIDEKGYIVVDKKMRTNVPGVYAAGDVTNLLPEFRQVVVAAAQGAIAAHSAYRFFKEQQ